MFYAFSSTHSKIFPSPQGGEKGERNKIGCVRIPIDNGISPFIYSYLFASPPGMIKKLSWWKGSRKGFDDSRVNLIHGNEIFNIPKYFLPDARNTY
jgi:hypothetical protein